MTFQCFKTPTSHPHREAIRLWFRRLCPGLCSGRLWFRDACLLSTGRVQPSMAHGSSPDFSGNPRGWTVEHWSSWAKQRPFLRWESVGLSKSQSVFFVFFWFVFFWEVHHKLTVYIKDQTWVVKHRTPEIHHVAIRPSPTAGGRLDVLKRSRDPKGPTFLGDKNDGFLYPLVMSK